MVRATLRQRQAKDPAPPAPTREAPRPSPTAVAPLLRARGRRGGAHPPRRTDPPSGSGRTEERSSPEAGGEKTAPGILRSRGEGMSATISADGSPAPHPPVLAPSPTSDRASSNRNRGRNGGDRSRQDMSRNFWKSPRARRKLDPGRSVSDSFPSMKRTPPIGNGASRRRVGPGLRLRLSPPCGLCGMRSRSLSAPGGSGPTGDPQS